MIPRAGAGVFTITAAFTNSSDDDFDDMHALVRILTGDNLVLNADNGPGGVDSIISVSPQDLGLDGALVPGESFTQVYEIGLTVRTTFDFFIDLFGATSCEVNIAPGADNDGYSVDEDGALVVDAPGVLGNDDDVNGDALTAALVSGSVTAL